MSEPWAPTDDEHTEQCEQAGCKHPAVYQHEDGATSQGWCALCRAHAQASLSDEAREIADADTQEWLDSLDDDARRRLDEYLRRGEG